MAARVGNPHVDRGGAGPSSSMNVQEMLDRWTSDLQKQGIAAQEDHARSVVDQLKDALKRDGFKADQRRSAPEQLQRMIVDFQRDRGLPPTGNLDKGTVDALKESGLLAPMRDQPVSQTQKGEAGGGEGRAKLRAEAELQHDARLQHRAGEQAVKQRIEGAEPVKPAQQLDPERLLAQLLQAGFKGAGGSQGLEDVLKSLQKALGIPQSGALDAKTVEALKEAGAVRDDATTSRPVKEANDAKAVKRALQETSTTSAKQADKATERDVLRPQQQTKEPVKSSEVAARASVNDAHAVPEQVKKAEQMRVDSATARQTAVERGVTEGTGDPLSTKGRGDVAGKGAGLSGKGGEGGGVGDALGAGAMALDGPEGNESAVGNSKAGDDKFADPKKGHASIGDDEEVWEEGHYRVDKLAKQVALALDEIARDGDGPPPTYGWNVTLYEPGVYSARQPAQPMWHMRIERATAFDERWTEAVNKISMLMLLHEPESDPPTLDDVVEVLRRARYAPASTS